MKLTFFEIYALYSEGKKMRYIYRNRVFCCMKNVKKLI